MSVTLSFWMTRPQPRSRHAASTPARSGTEGGTPLFPAEVPAHNLIAEGASVVAVAGDLHAVRRSWDGLERFLGAADLNYDAAAVAARAFAAARTSPRGSAAWSHSVARSK